MSISTRGGIQRKHRSKKLFWPVRNVACLRFRFHDSIFNKKYVYHNKNKKVSISKEYAWIKGPIIFYVESILDIGIYPYGCHQILMHVLFRITTLLINTDKFIRILSYFIWMNSLFHENKNRYSLSAHFIQHSSLICS